jgi:hypothetical protein
VILGSQENDKHPVESDANNYREGNDTSAYFQHGQEQEIWHEGGDLPDMKLISKAPWVLRAVSDNAQYHCVRW